MAYNLADDIISGKYKKKKTYDLADDIISGDFSKRKIEPKKIEPTKQPYQPLMVQQPVPYAPKPFTPSALDVTKRVFDTTPTPAQLFEKSMQQLQEREQFKQQFPALAERYKSPDIAKYEVGKESATRGGLSGLTLGLAPTIARSVGSEQERQLEAERQQLAQQDPRYTVGEYSAMLAPGTAFTKGAGKVMQVGAKKFAPEIGEQISKKLIQKGLTEPTSKAITKGLQYGTQEALAGTGMALSESGFKGETPEQALQRVRDYGLFGGLIGGGAPIVGRGFSKVFGKRPPVAPLTQAVEEVAQPITQPKPTRPLTPSLEIPQAGFKPPKLEIEYKPSNFKTLKPQQSISPFARSKMKKAKATQQAETIPEYVQRIEEPNVTRATTDKPHGVYTSPSDVVSPHEGLGGDKFYWKTNPNAKVLKVDATDMFESNRGLTGQGAGIPVARQFLGDDVVSTMMKTPKEELAQQLSTKYPDVEWNKYYDQHEMVETVGAIEARNNGYDAIWSIDKDMPQYNEFVGLNDNAFKPVDELPTKQKQKLELRRGKEQFGLSQVEPRRTQFDVPLERIEQPFAEISQEPSKSMKQRRFASNSLMESDVIPQSMKDDISKNMPEYEPITNKETWDKATSEVIDNYDESINKWKATDKIKNADDTALGQALMVDAIQKGDTKLANEIAYELSEKLTEAGQAVQAASILKRLSPEGMLTYVNRTLQRAERILGDKFKGKLKLTTDETQSIVDRMNRMRDMSEGRSKDIEFAEIQRIVSEKIPATAREKLKAMQRINLLFNPKTMIRNVVGNVIMGGVKNVKDYLRTGIDEGVSRVFKTDRTVAKPSLKTQREGFAQGIRTTLDDYKRGIDTSGVSTQFELSPYRTTSPFKSKIYKKADELTRLGLRLGDSPFYKAAYDDVIQQQLKVKGLTEATPEIKEMAERIAKETTFQDVNRYTKFFDGFRNVLNSINVKGFGLGDVVLPFTKTPANILKTGIEYSPLNVINVVNDALKFSKSKGSIDQYRLVDNLSKTLTGTGLLGAGMWLADQGIIEARQPTDWDAASFKRQQGLLPYSINIGDKNVSFDWAQPASMALAIGADIYNSYKNEEDPVDAMIEGAKGGIGTILSQSMVQGLEEFFSSYTRDGTGLLQSLEEAGYDALLQLMPFNALSRQLAEATDTVQRSTYDDTKLESKLLNQFKRNVPGLRQTLPERFKTTGEPEKARNLFNIFLNPANVGSPEMTPAKEEILRLYEESGEKIQFPRIAPKKVKPPKIGNRVFDEVILTGEQRSEYQKDLGQNTLRRFEQTVNTPQYRMSNDEAKARLLQKIISDENTKSKTKLINKYNLRKSK